MDLRRVRGFSPSNIQYKKLQGLPKQALQANPLFWNVENVELFDFSVGRSCKILHAAFASVDVLVRG